MSDWKVRKRLLDVLFSSWGIVVPAIDNAKDNAYYGDADFFSAVICSGKVFFLSLL